MHSNRSDLAPSAPAATAAHRGSSRVAPITAGRAWPSASGISVTGKAGWDLRHSSAGRRLVPAQTRSAAHGEQGLRSPDVVAGAPWCGWCAAGTGVATLSFVAVVRAWAALDSTDGAYSPLQLLRLRVTSSARRRKSRHWRISSAKSGAWSTARLTQVGCRGRGPCSNPRPTADFPCSCLACKRTGRFPWKGFAHRRGLQSTGTSARPPRSAVLSS